MLNEFAMQERADGWEMLPSLKNLLLATFKKILILVKHFSPAGQDRQDPYAR